MPAYSFWKAKAATLVCVSKFFLIGLGAALLPALGSAQSLNVQAWQKAVKNSLTDETGCFVASYPGTQWQQIPCESQQSQNVIVPGNPQAGVVPSEGNAGPSQKIQALQQGAINGIGYSASAVGGPISAAEGTFINVSGVTSITDTYHNTSDTYSLQLNSDYFALSDSSLCGNSSTCKGWVQFVYQNSGTPSAGVSTGNFSIWYWLINTSSCPAGWQSYSGVFCYYNPQSLSLPGQAISGFNQIDVRGQTSNGVDTGFLTIGGQVYSVKNSSPIQSLPQDWHEAQFNVFGLGNNSTANFSTGSSLTVTTAIDNGTTNAPTCTTDGESGESNNLNYNSPCCPYSGGKPSIAFMEGTATGITVSACSSLGNNTITPVVTPAAGGTISPAAALNVPNGAVSSFTVTPNSGYQISSVTGCGGTLNGNTFTTAAATASCTVTATFTSTTTPTYTVTASAGTGGAINPSGAVSVTSGTAKSFTITPNSGYTITTPVGGTCGGSLSGNTYTTKAITTNCTVAAAFTATTPIYTVTASAGTGGAISPSGAVFVTSGQTQSFTVTPNTGYSVSMGGSCGGSLSGNTYTTKAVTTSCTVTAAFTATNYTVTSSAGAGGTINPSGSASVSYGTTKAYTVTPNTGYSISAMGGSCGGSLSGNTYTTKAITTACTVTATFVAASTNNPTVTLTNITPSGSASPAAGAPVSISPNGTATFTITPPTGSTYVSWAGATGGCGSISLASTWYIGQNLVLNVGPVTSNCTFPLAFTVPNPTVTLTAITPSGSASPAMGTAVPVGSNGSTTFTITPPAGATYASWAGWSGGCGAISLASTWYIGKNLVLTVGPVTSNCTFPVAFSSS